MSQTTPITVSADINAPVERVWECYNTPEHITQWNFASDDWHCPSAENDLKVGGKLSSRMEAKDGSAGFDFGGTYTEVVENEKVAFDMDDGRKVEVVFAPENGSVKVNVTFDPEEENSRELQQQGWQAILDNFKKYVEGE